MYELLVRSRCYALGWALFTAASAATFTTTGADAWFFSIKPDARTRQEAGENEFRAWAEDDKRRMGDETGFDASSPEHVRDGLPPRADTGGAVRNTAPFSASDTDEDLADGSVSP